jgi:hypothetical protein
MTLQVPFEDFAATAARFGLKETYYIQRAGLVILTAANLENGSSLVSSTTVALEEVVQGLTAKGLAVHRGFWSFGDKPEMGLSDGEMSVAVVAYDTGHSGPGVWVDAYNEEPTHVAVLEAIYEEFRHTGEMPDVTIEQFINTAKPNVIVLSQSRLRGFAAAKLGT